MYHVTMKMRIFKIKITPWTNKIRALLMRIVNWKLSHLSENHPTYVQLNGNILLNSIKVKPFKKNVSKKN